MYFDVRFGLLYMNIVSTVVAMLTTNSHSSAVIARSNVTFGCLTDTSFPIRWQYISPDSSIVQRINSGTDISTKFAARYSIGFNETTGLSYMFIIYVQMNDGGTFKCLEQHSSNEHLNFQLIVFDSEPVCSITMVDYISATPAVDVNCQVNYKGNIIPDMECSSNINGSVSRSGEPFNSLKYTKRSANYTGHTEPFICTTQFTSASRIKDLTPPSVGIPDYIHRWTSSYTHPSQEPVQYTPNVFTNATPCGDSPSNTATLAIHDSPIQSMVEEGVPSINTTRIDLSFNLVVLIGMVVLCITIAVIAVVIAVVTTSRKRNRQTPVVQPTPVIVVRKGKSRHRHLRSRSREANTATILDNGNHTLQQQLTIVELSDSSSSIGHYSEMSHKSQEWNRSGDRASYQSLDHESVTEVNIGPVAVYDELTTS